MEKAFKLDFVNDKTGSLYVNCCGCSQTAPLHSFGPASKPHYLIHYVLSGKGHFRFHDKEYRLEAGYGFLIQPNELAFYQADAKDPWSYLWVGFAGSRAEEYLHSMGLSDRHPIFSCDKSEELYSIVRDMMEHNTFGIADDLRRNGLLGVFLSVIADSAGVVAREEEDKGNQYVKKELRKRMALLKTLHKSTITHQSHSAEILAALEAHPAFRTASTILLYHSLPDEVDTHSFIRKWSAKKQILLPVVTGDDLELRVYTGPGDLATGAYGIEEPTGALFTDYDAIDFIVVPGVAFDRNGNRLGRGKGYYDRLLPRIPSAYKAGICFPFQIVEEVPAEMFDIRMDKVITCE